MLYIYDNFVLQGVIERFTQLRWKRKYNDLNTFELTMPFDKSLFDLIKPDMVLYKQDVQEGCFIKNINIYTDVDSNRRMIITGLGIENILSERTAAITTTNTVSNIIRTVLNTNFINASVTDRNIPEFILGSLEINNNPSETVDYQNKVSCMEIITNLLQPNNIGFRVRMDFNSEEYIFELYEGNYNETIVFTENYGNIVSQDIYFITKDYKNVVYVDDRAIGSGVGINRKETAVNSVKDENATVTGQRVLKNLESKSSVDAQIDMTSKQFIYLEDWDLGDIVTFKDTALNFIIQQNILEINEFYSVGKKQVDVVFGDMLSETYSQSNANN